jgi:hypothetical protein
MWWSASVFYVIDFWTILMEYIKKIGLEHNNWKIKNCQRAGRDD